MTPQQTARGFFRRHHAVPATDRGPDWAKATDEALLGWWESTWPVVRCGWDREKRWSAPLAQRKALLPLYNQLAGEIHRRFAKPDCAPAVAAAHFLALTPFPTPLGD